MAFAGEGEASFLIRRTFSSDHCATSFVLALGGSHSDLHRARLRNNIS
jgi:hypothetical protein